MFRSRLHDGELTLVLLLVALQAHAGEDDGYGGITAERIELRLGENTREWDIDTWFGGDYRKLIARSEGTTGGDEEENAELQLLASFAVGPYSDAYSGIRVEDLGGQTIAGIVIGLQGDARYLIDYNLAAFATENGDVLLRAELERQFLLTQRWIVEARLEVNASLSDSDLRNTDAGFSQSEVGFRLRYEVTRRFAPYVGWEWKQEFRDSKSDTYALVGLSFSY